MEEPELFSTCIMLVPDERLKSKRPDVHEIHLTLAYFGKYAPGAYQVTELRKSLEGIAKQFDGPIPAVANGTGIFPDRDRFAIVDLIDGIDVFYARKAVENLWGRERPAAASLDLPRIDYTHGFTPHVTREYLMADDIEPEHLLPTDPIEFAFDAIGVWHGPNHFEVEL